MKTMFHTIVSAALLALLTFSLHAHAMESDSSTSRLSSTVTTETLQANIKEVEASADLDESTRKKLVELYRSALAYLEQAGSHDKAARGIPGIERIRTSKCQGRYARNSTNGSSLMNTSPRASRIKPRSPRSTRSC